MCTLRKYYEKSYKVIILTFIFELYLPQYTDSF